MNALLLMVVNNLLEHSGDVVMGDIIAWQNRPLNKVYPVLYLDCIVVKCHQDKRVINKAVYIALAIDCLGQRHIYFLCRWTYSFSQD